MCWSWFLDSDSSWFSCSVMEGWNHCQSTGQPYGIVRCNTLPNSIDSIDWSVKLKMILSMMAFWDIFLQNVARLTPSGTVEANIVKRIEIHFVWFVYECRVIYFFLNISFMSIQFQSISLKMIKNSYQGDLPLSLVDHRKLKCLKTVFYTKLLYFVSRYVNSMLA